MEIDQNNYLIIRLKALDVLCVIDLATIFHQDQNKCGACNLQDQGRLKSRYFQELGKFGFDCKWLEFY